MKIELLPQKMKIPIGLIKKRWNIIPKVLCLFFVFFCIPICLDAEGIDFPENEKTSLIDALQQLSKDYQVFFSYDQEIVQDVEVNFEPEEYTGITHALDEMLVGTTLKYKMFNNRYIILYERSPEALSSLRGMVQHLETVIDTEEKENANKKKYSSLIPLPPHIKGLSVNTISFSLKGKVIDQEGEPLIGVNIQVKGSSKGTATDFDGDFILEDIDENAVLVISYVGYQTQEIPIAGKSNLEIMMISDSQLLDEIVVTALGIEQRKRTMSSSSQQLNADNLKSAREINVLNSLQGEIAGLSINPGSTGVGSESRVVLRGNRSINGDSQPLYVIDGVPIRGNPSTLNSDNIESINVLKGANAAALYGSSAQNGVVLITTIKGEKNRTDISFNSNFMFREPIMITEYQNIYGQGQGGIYDKTSENSWGPKMSGQMVDFWSIDPKDTGRQYALTPQPNNTLDLHQTGFNLSENIIARIGGEKTQTVLSYTYTNAAGVIPNNNLDRHNISVRIDNQLLTKLNATAKLDYTNQTVNNEFYGGRYNPTQMIIELPRNIQVDHLRNYEFLDEQGTMLQNYFSPSSPTGGNPFWILNRTPNERLRQRIIGLGSLSYDFTRDLKLTTRFSFDGAYTHTEERLFYDNYASAPSGRYTVTTGLDWLFNTDFLLSYNKKISDWEIDVNAGGEIRKHRDNSLSSNTGTAMVVPNFFSISNTNLAVTTFNPGTLWDKQSLYAMGMIGWKNAVFLNVTGRNDWSSTLSADNRSFFYPSIGISAVMSDLFNLPDYFSYAKIRTSKAWVGNDAPPYMLNRTANFSAGGNNGFLALSSTLPNKDLLPEKTESLEFGLDLAFFDDRLDFNLTYYNTQTGNQLFTIALPVGSGASSFFTNGGNIENKGFEGLMSIFPIMNNDFEWKLGLNFGLNRNVVTKISDDRPQINMNPNNFISNFVLEQGKPYGEIYSRGFLRNDNGDVLVSNDGMPRVTNGLTERIGNFNPDWTGGLNNNFRYKSFNLNFLIEHRQGGSIISGTNAILDGLGVTKRTLLGREGGLVFGDNLFPQLNAVSEEDGAKNTIEIDSEKFWRGIGGRNAPIGEAFVQNATNTRLRQLILSYTLPVSMLSNLPFSNIDISLVGRNLFYIYRKSKDLDPDFMNGIDPLSQGSQQFTPITTRSFGVNISINL